MAADDETQRQLTEIAEDLAAKRSEREAVRRRLHVLEERAAEMGRDAPAHITTEIADLLVKRRELDDTIAELGKRRARLELAPQSGLILPPGEVLPQLAPAVIDTRITRIEQLLASIRYDLTDHLQDHRRKDAADEAWREVESSARARGQHKHQLGELAQFVIMCIIALGVLLIVAKLY